jgi:protein SCO1/2
MKSFRVKLAFSFSLLLSLILCSHCEKRDLPVFGKVPDFHLTNQDNHPYSKNELQGKVWVANFIFTSCGMACPLLTEKMKWIQGQILEARAKSPDIPAYIISFSVDPERDTPEKLLQYAKQHGVDTHIWNFLTGPLDAIGKTVVDGFKISMGKVPVPIDEMNSLDTQLFEVVHGEHFVLIDQLGQIRGYYSVVGPGLRKLWNDFQYLLQKGAS